MSIKKDFAGVYLSHRIYSFPPLQNPKIIFFPLSKKRNSGKVGENHIYKMENIHPLATMRKSTYGQMGLKI